MSRYLVRVALFCAADEMFSSIVVGDEVSGVIRPIRKQSVGDAGSFILGARIRETHIQACRHTKLRTWFLRAVRFPLLRLQMY